MVLLKYYTMMIIESLVPLYNHSVNKYFFKFTILGVPYHIVTGL